MGHFLKNNPMNLFTTIQSERGKPVSKSGNEYIRLVMQDESRQDRVILQFTNCVGGINISLKDLETKKILYSGFIKPKTVTDYTPYCPEYKSTMTDTGKEWVCDKEDCGYNLMKPKIARENEEECTHESTILSSEGVECADCHELEPKTATEKCRLCKQEIGNKNCIACNGN